MHERQHLCPHVSIHRVVFSLQTRHTISSSSSDPANTVSLEAAMLTTEGFTKLLLFKSLTNHAENHVYLWEVHGHKCYLLYHTSSINYIDKAYLAEPNLYCIQPIAHYHPHNMNLN